MKPNDPLEDRLEALGSALRARPRLADGVMVKLRASITEGSMQLRSTRKPRAAIGRRWRIFAAAVATSAVILLIALLLFPSPTVGWAEVTKAIQSKEWIRGTVTYSDGRRGTMWLSPTRQVWARTSGSSSFYFSDGRNRTKDEFQRGRDRITRVPLRVEDSQRVLPTDALSQDKDKIGPWLFGSEKIVSQKRREVTEDGKTWIEFQMVLWRGGTNQATLRVDPETRLPVYLLCTSPEDAMESFKWRFDYPDEGPTDIYALGVPKEIKINNCMPLPEALRVLDGMAASRARVGDFRLLAAWQKKYPGYVVWRRGDRWRVDVCQPRWDSPRRPQEPTVGQTVRDWFVEYLKRSQQGSRYICDGRTVYENRNFREQDGKKPRWQPTRTPAPQDLLSGPSCFPDFKLVPLLYPDLTPDAGMTFEFDPEPSDAPGCVLIKRSMLLTNRQIGHDWHYIDPAKGYAVVRTELFSLPADTRPDPEVNSGAGGLRMNEFQRSQDGFWYPTVIYEMSSAKPRPDQPNQGAAREVEATFRCYFDFDADLPDSLFTIDESQAPQP